MFLQNWISLSDRYHIIPARVATSKLLIIFIINLFWQITHKPLCVLNIKQ